MILVHVKIKYKRTASKLFPMNRTVLPISQKIITGTRICKYDNFGANNLAQGIISWLVQNNNYIIKPCSPTAHTITVSWTKRQMLRNNPSTNEHLRMYNLTIVTWQYMRTDGVSTKVTGNTPWRHFQGNYPLEKIPGSDRVWTRLVGRIGSWVRGSASFQIFVLRMLLHSTGSYLQGVVLYGLISGGCL